MAQEGTPAAAAMAEEGTETEGMGGGTRVMVGGREAAAAVGAARMEEARLVVPEEAAVKAEAVMEGRLVESPVALTAAAG